MIDLSIKIGNLTIKNPIMLASGTCGYGEELDGFIDYNSIGGIVTKGISIEPRKGNTPPRICETPAGMLNAIGLQNVGVDAFLNKKSEYLKTINTAVIVNILGSSIEEYGRLAGSLNAASFIDAIEVNISCPNVKEGGISFGSDPEIAYKVIKEVKNNTDFPIITKLTPNVTDITLPAKACEEAGSDALSCINTITGMAIDINTGKPKLANIFGGLSGPAIKPIALRMVWQTARAVSIPVIGIGGITTIEDAIEFLLAGASALQIGTATFRNPKASMIICNGICNYMKKHDISTISEFSERLKLN